MAGQLLGNTGTVEVNAAQIEKALEMAYVVVEVRGVVDKIVSDTIDRNVRLQITYNGEPVEPRESEQRVFDAKWPDFLRALQRALVVVGLAVVSRDQYGIPFVQEFNRVRIMFRSTTRRPREYWAEELSRVGVRSKMDALVIVKHPPDAHGNLTAPGSIVVPYAVSIKRMLACNDVMVHENAHPTWVYEAAPEQHGVPNPAEQDRFYEGEQAEEWSRFQKMIVDQQQEVFARMQTQAQMVHSANVEASGRFMEYSLVPEELQRHPAFMKYTFVPLGLRLAQPPRPAFNPRLHEDIEMLSAKIMQAFRVPPMVMEVSHSTRYAAQPEQAEEQWDETVAMLQSELAANVSRIYMFCNADALREYALGMVNSANKLRAELVATMGVRLPDDISTLMDEKASRPAPKRPRRLPQTPDADADAVGSPTRGASDPDPDPDHDPDSDSDPDAPREIPKVQTADSGDMQFTDTAESVRRAAAVLGIADSDIIAYVLQRFHVTIQFSERRTRQKEERIERAVDRCVVPMSLYAKKMAPQLGVPAEELLVDHQERIAEAAERAKVAEALTPPSAKKPAAAPKKRKTPP